MAPETTDLGSAGKPGCCPAAGVETIVAMSPTLDPPAEDCVFCAIARGRTDADLVAYRSARVLVIPTLMQRDRNRGHSLVIPVSHVTSLAAAEPELRHEVFDVVAMVTEAVRRAFGAVGSTLVQNNDVPGQVLHHLHVGVVPRFVGDAYRVPDPDLTATPREVRAELAVRLRAELATALP